VEFKDFNFVKDVKPAGRNTTVERRKRLIKAIEYQSTLADDELRGTITLTGRKKASWFWLNEDGIYFCSIKYGRKPIELDKGKYSFVAPCLQELIVGLDAIKEMVSRGDFDAKMVSMSKEIRQNFNK